MAGIVRMGLRLLLEGDVLTPLSLPANLVDGQCAQPFCRKSATDYVHAEEKTDWGTQGWSIDVCADHTGKAEPLMRERAEGRGNKIGGFSTGRLRAERA